MAWLALLAVALAVGFLSTWPVGLVSGLLAAATTYRYTPHSTHTVSYLGEFGIMEARCSRSPERITRRRVFLYAQAMEVTMRVVHRRFRQGTEYIWTYRNDRKRCVYRQSVFVPDGRSAHPREDQAFAYRTAQAFRQTLRKW